MTGVYKHPHRPQSEKDPRYVASGKAGARVRWGIPRTVSLRGLTSAQREFVIETVDDLRRAAQESVT